MLNEVPMRGTGTPMPPTDPLIYRFYEMVMVNGPAWKALIEEEFGDGIMSAIDFDMAMERVAQSQGRPGQDHDVRQVPAVQILRRQRQRAGVWVQGGVTGGKTRSGDPFEATSRECDAFPALLFGHCPILAQGLEQAIHGEEGIGQHDAADDRARDVAFVPLIAR